MRELETAMAKLKSSDLDSALKRYDKLNLNFENMGGYEANSRLKGVLRGLGFTEAQWRGRISDRSVTFFAYDETDDKAPAGLAGVFVEDGAAQIVSMWVRPAFRGRGVGEALIEATASWAKSRSFPALFLWVTESNAPARRLYARCGFTPTGERQPLPSDPSLPEIQLSRPL